MSDLVKLNDERITSDFFIQYLKFHDQFEELMEKVLSDRITIQLAAKYDVSANDEELQERIDQIRRVKGLHRAVDTMEYIEELGFTVDQFGDFLRDELIKGKMLERICSDSAINQYFKLHSPDFDAVELCHIMVESEGKARELVAILEDDPDSFGEMAEEHSLSADTARNGGSLGKVSRGMLSPEIEAKVFNADIGQVIGPFGSDEELTYEIFRVDARHDAQLDAATTDTIKTELHRTWIQTQLDENQIEFL